MKKRCYNRHGMADPSSDNPLGRLAQELGCLLGKVLADQIANASIAQGSDARSGRSRSFKNPEASSSNADANV